MVKTEFLKIILKKFPAKFETFEKFEKYGFLKKKKK